MNNGTRLKAMKAYKEKKISLAKVGLILAWISSVTAVMQGIFNGATTSIIGESTNDIAIVSIIISITVLAVNDIFAGIWTLGYNLVTNRSIKEYKRVMGVKVSWMMLAAAVAAGPIATGCWMSAVSFCGITIVASIISISPILTAVIGHFVFKENMNGRMILGIVISVIGVIVAGWAKPEGMNNFTIGVILALLAPIGFAIEGILSTYAADIIDPLVGCSLHRCFGSGVSGLIIISIIAVGTGNLDVVGHVVTMIFTTPELLIYIIIMGLLAGASYGTTYGAFNKCGPTRTLAVVYTMPIWSIPAGYLFDLVGIQPYSVGMLGVIGAFVVVVGISLVIAKPSDLFNIRNID